MVPALGPEQAPDSMEDLHPALLRAAESGRRLQESLGRPLRVAHVGNIANNAYLAAKAERALGVDSYAISPSYSHVMGFPSWEESCLTCLTGRHFSGDLFPSVAPEWFLSGSWQEVARKATGASWGPRRIGAMRAQASRLVDRSYERFRERLLTSLSKKAQDWVANNALFSVRYRLSLASAERLADRFDLVTAYGPYNAYFPRVTDKLVSTEHGTLRDFIWADTLMSKRSLWGYRNSRAILVTNQDNLQVAYQLATATGALVMPMPHPSNPATPRCVGCESMLAEIDEGGEWLTVLAPARHSTPSTTDRGKGSQHLYEAMREIARLELPIRFVLIAWGDQAAKVRTDMSDLEATGRVIWLPLVTRPLLYEVMLKSQVVLDQFLIPAYGAIGLDALRAGALLLTRSDSQLDTAFFGSPAPVINVESSSDIVAALTSRLESELSDKSAVSSWFQRHASWEVALATRMAVYERVLLEGS